MGSVLAKDPDLDGQQLESFNIHRMLCQRCAREFEESGEILDLVCRHWGFVSPEMRELLEKARGRGACDTRAAGGSMDAENGWEDLKRRLPELEAGGGRRTIYRLASVAALAACVVLAVSLVWVVVGRGDAGTGTCGVGVSSTAVTPRVGLITETGGRVLDTGRPIMTGEHQKELRLGGMHRVVMNANTSVVVKGSGEEQRGYAIELARGELYVEVVPGSCFTVQTRTALLEITGTKFNVRAEGDRTDLVLVEGSIRFGRRDKGAGAVDVKGGYGSSINGRSLPTPPQTMNVQAAIAWIDGRQTRGGVAATRPTGSIQDLLMLSGKLSCGSESAAWSKFVRQLSELLPPEVPLVASPATRPAGSDRVSGDQ